MTELDPSKLHVRYVEERMRNEFSIPRCYTLTHSDRTGDRFLTIGRCYDQEQISGYYTRFMRDEVLGEWIDGNNGLELHVHMHVNGGFIFGNAGLRYRIFKKYLRSVMQSLRQGDDPIFNAMPSLDRCRAVIHYHAKCDRYNLCEEGGQLKEYRME